MLFTVSPRFSATTTGCLVNAGWHPGRHAPVSADTETALAAAGHELLPSARAFLAEFGGLTVVHPHFRVPGTLDHFIIEALLATNGRDEEWVREYERRTKERALTPVGEASRGYLIMCMDPGGAVYGGYDDVLLQLGTSGDDTLEALCTGREPLQIR
jgi:SUKH-3 immunity protein